MSNWDKFKEEIKQKQIKSGTVATKKRRVTKVASETTISNITTTTTTTTAATVTVDKQVEKPDIWFDDIDESLLASTRSGATKDGVTLCEYTEMSSLPTSSAAAAVKTGRFVAIDCEMVGVGPDGKDSALARVSIVNYHGRVILDKYVRPKERVTDYRTLVSGITAAHMKSAHSFEEVQKEVAAIISDRVVVGHAIKNDFRVLLLSHPERLIRDTTKYLPFRKMYKGRTPGLRHLARDILKRTIQDGQHSSVDDARATMDLYKSIKDRWEAELNKKLNFRTNVKKLAKKVDAQLK